MLLNINGIGISKYFRYVAMVVFFLCGVYYVVFFKRCNQAENIYNAGWHSVVIKYYKSQNHGEYYLVIKNISTGLTSEWLIDGETTGFGTLVQPGDTLFKGENSMKVKIQNQDRTSDHYLRFYCEEHCKECN